MKPGILVRVDDFPAWAESMDRFMPAAEFERFHRILADNGVSYLLGVIPQPSTEPLKMGNRETRHLSAQECSLLQQITTEGASLALHGVTHQTRSAKKHSEFTEMDNQSFRERIRYGCAEVKRQTGLTPEAFIPPFNRITQTQLEILANRFRVICGGPESVPLLGARKVEVLPSGAIYVPSYFPFYGRTHQIIPALDQAALDELTCVTLHWEWERRLNYQHLPAFCTAVRPRLYTWEELLHAVSH